MTQISLHAPPVKKYVSPVPPPISGLENVARHDPELIEGIWRLFNNFPKNPARLQKAYVALVRLATMRHKSMLPARRVYTTTVDYYEAALPLFVARAHFRTHFLPSASLRTMADACKDVLPEQLF